MRQGMTVGGTTPRICHSISLEKGWCRAPCSLLFSVTHCGSLGSRNLWNPPREGSTVLISSIFNSRLRLYLCDFGMVSCFYNLEV